MHCIEVCTYRFKTYSRTLGGFKRKILPLFNPRLTNQTTLTSSPSSWRANAKQAGERNQSSGANSEAGEWQCIKLWITLNDLFNAADISIRCPWNGNIGEKYEFWTTLSTWRSSYLSIDFSCDVSHCSDASKMKWNVHFHNDISTLCSRLVSTSGGATNKIIVIFFHQILKMTE